MQRGTAGQKIKDMQENLKRFEEEKQLEEQWVIPKEVGERL